MSRYDDAFVDRKIDDRVRFRRAIISSNCYDAMSVPAAMSKTVRLSAALPTAQKRLDV
jgi:hypothetical protein